MSEGTLISSRRAIIKAGLALAALTAPAGAFAAQSPETAAPGTTAGYPGEAADRLLFAGFRRTTIETKGLVVNDATASGATINTWSAEAGHRSFSSTVIPRRTSPRIRSQAP